MYENKKNIEVITGNGNNLDISKVYNHLPIEKPKLNKQTKKIIIPNENKYS